MSQDHEEECSKQTQVGKPRRTNSPRFNPDEDGKRRATLMRRVHQVRTKGQRIEVSLDAKGQPLGKEGDKLQSLIGVLAREHIPIWISDFRSANLAPRKEIVWMEVVTSFTVEESFKKQVLKSCGESAKGFRYDLYQAFFEKTRKYADRHERWLDIRVKLDGQFKKETFKSIADTIDDFIQQETQGSFESVGTEDILTKALGNAEHLGWIRGQSKFVKQSQYFNLVQPTRENAEVSDMKRQLAALEITIQELYAKHGINRETMTVDQHNSFKASCTINEKEAGLAYMDCVPTDTVHGIPLGEENASKGPSRAPDREAEGSKHTKKRAGRKKIQSQPEVEQQPAQQELPSFDFNDIFFELRPLAYYAQSSMRDGTQTVCSQQQFVMGDEMPIYIGFEDVYHFITFKEISAKSIMIYIRYLVECCARIGMDKRFEFISPVLVSPVQQNVDRATYVRERADYIVRILKNAPKGKQFLMPYNSGQHWILTVIDPWDDSVMYFNPLRNEPGDDFKDLIMTGMRQRHNWQTLIDTVRCPIQKGYVECGYFVLAYMREITFTVDGLAVLQTKDFYTDADMSTFVMCGDNHTKDDAYITGIIPGVCSEPLGWIPPFGAPQPTGY
ncbi:hypothetical protein TIFTF001_030906 [Ficus carica]|uniref:Ubiquitin-like protease family profile domain-containing protein n=1 Tax=Ficus carica TaxID=3494 RepID=A0AA88J4S7_FICCA|nr:hypothetical protein TIFTF001_030906 [Ficus carica]